MQLAFSGGALEVGSHVNLANDNSAPQIETCPHVSVKVWRVDMPCEARVSAADISIFGVATKG